MGLAASGSAMLSNEEDRLLPVISLENEKNGGQ
jgi:hypothetical protein